MIIKNLPTLIVNNSYAAARPSMNQLRCARNCLAAGYFISLGTPTLSRRYARLAAVSLPAYVPVIHKCVSPIAHKCYE